jgi:hypothetical protein
MWLAFAAGLLTACADTPQVEEVVDYSSYRITTVRGVVPNVDGQTAIVEIVAAVEPGQDLEAAAWEKLQRMVPEAVPVGQWRYALTGLVWDDGWAGHYYNPKGQPDSTARSAWVDSWTLWNAESGSSFEFLDWGDTGRCPSLVAECRGPQKFDGNNDIGWVTIREQYVLGVTWYSTSIDEYDMALDNGPEWSWYFGDPNGIGGNDIDTTTIFAHEFGHALGLGHSEFEDALMYAYYSGGTQRWLHSDDIDGLVALYPAETCTDDAECDDLLNCNGVETCVAGTCVDGAPPDCGDGVDCTVDTCVEPGSCEHTPDDGYCDDGAACTDYWCDPVLDCQQAVIPDCTECKPRGEVCDTGDECCSGQCHPKKGTCK